jgi:hypothetical protein
LKGLSYAFDSEFDVPALCGCMLRAFPVRASDGYDQSVWHMAGTPPL